MILLRSLLFNLIFWLSVPVYAPLALLTFPLPYRWRYRLISAWARFHTWLAKVLLRIDYTVEGRERFTISVRLAQDFRNDISEIKRTPVQTSGYGNIPLSSVADISVAEGPPMINSEKMN
ncbi:MAG: hypothetical protein AAB329_01165, partial [Pseudomonadota bacterium]